MNKIERLSARINTMVAEYQQDCGGSLSDETMRALLDFANGIFSDREIIDVLALAEIGLLAIKAEVARKAHAAARKVRGDTNAAYYEEGGERDDDGFDAACGPAHADYMAATRSASSATNKMRRAACAALAKEQP